MNQDQVISLLRTILKIAGGALAAHGLTNAASWINGEDVTGLVLAVAGIICSHYTHAPDPTSPPAAKLGLWFLIGCLALSLGAVGCVHLSAGADPLVVRTEQVQTMAHSTFDTFLKIDNANRSFWKTNVPALHEFAEKLRVPTPSGTNTLPYADALLMSLDETKLAYKTGRASSNELFIVLTTLETAISETQHYITIGSTTH